MQTQAALKNKEKISTRSLHIIRFLLNVNENLYKFSNQAHHKIIFIEPF